MRIDAKAYWTIAPDRGEIRDETICSPGPNDVLVRTRYSGISRGTEALVARGRVPASQANAMRCPFQAGAFPFPVKYGYCNVGVVEAGPTPFVGRRVFCLYPHQSRFVVPAAAVHPLPDALGDRRAVLTANLETALNAVWDASLLPGERVLVIGAGVVGCLIARLAVQLPGTEVTLVDIDPAKAGIAAALAVPFRTLLDDQQPADCLFNAAAAPEALVGALAVAGFEARIVEVSWYGDRLVPLPLGEAFHSRRLKLVGSQVGSVSPAMRPRFDHARRLAKAMDILAADDCLDALLEDDTPFDALPEALPRLLAGGGLCHVVAYPADGGG
jgi:2-desacetyl-2-hydroxyethyl bacteriochlorophyllide A dehydrogenase